MNWKRFFCWALLSSALLGGAAAIAAETLESSPWVGWKKGYEAYDRGSRMKEANRYREALSAYRDAARYFDAVRRIFPDWNRTMIDGRVRLCEEEITNLSRLAGGSLAPLEEPPAAVPPSSREGRSRTAAAPERSSASGSRLYVEMQAELDQYKQRWNAALAELDELKIKLQQAEAGRTDVEGLLRDYRKLQERYALLEVQYENAKASGGSAERKILQEQLLELNRKLAEQQQALLVEQEKSRRQQEEYAASRREVLALKQQLEESGNQAKRMERELSLVGSRTGALAAKDAELLKLRTDLEEAQAALSASRARVAESAAMQEKLQKSGETSLELVLTAENNRLQNELEQLRAAQRRNDVERLQTRVDELTGMQDTLAESLQRSTAQQQRLEQENKTLNQKLLSAHAEQEQSAAEHQVQQERIAQLEKDLRTWQTRYTELDKRLQERLNADALSSGSLSEVNRQLTAKLAERDKQYAELSRVHEELKKLHAKEAEAGAAVRQQMLDLRTKAAAQEVTAGKLAALQKAYDELAAQPRESAAPKADEARLLALEEVVKRYEQENRTLNRKLEHAAAELEKLRKTPRPEAQTQQALAQLSTVLAPEKIETLLADAEKAEASGNAEVAIWGYRQILERQPGHPEALFRLGKLLGVRGDLAAAEPLLTAAAAARPDSAEVAASLMRVQIADKKYDAAHRCFQAFTAHAAPTPELQLIEAVAWSRSGDPVKAEPAFKAALAADPANVEAAMELALLLSAKPERRPEALQFYRQAQQHGAGTDPYLEETLKPVTGGDLASREFLFHAALEALQQRDSTTADWYAQQLRELQKNDEFAQRLQAWSLLVRQDYPGAGKAAKALPEDFSSSLLAVAAALGRGAIPAAEAGLKSAAGKRPADFRLAEPQLTLWKTVLNDLAARCKTDSAKAALQQLNVLLLP